jgi:hypothetical protein
MGRDGDRDKSAADRIGQGDAPSGSAIAAGTGTDDQPPAGRDASVDAPTKLPMIGVRKLARQLQVDLSATRDENASIRAHLERVGALTVFDLEQEAERLSQEIATQRERIEAEQKAAVIALEKELAEARRTDERRREELATALRTGEEELRALRELIVATRDEQLLQEVGVYDFRHPLDDSVAYKARLEAVRKRIKEMARANGGAVTATTDWTVNGSKTEGRKMVREFSKLMLRAYNSEVDALARNMKPYRLDAAVERLRKSKDTIAKLGRTMHIEIAGSYHRLRIEELELTADYLERVAQEKEAEREEKARLREERKAQQEMQRERERLEKERAHYENALRALEAKGDAEAAGKLREQLSDVDRAIEDVDYRAANIRAGYVYVISNVGAFGERMIKIGMTRRLEPLDRVRELGDASVPFRFDVHALFFSEDAVGIEQAMHQRLADRRVNMVNLRREFFYATPQEAKALLLELRGDLLEYVEEPEALEFRQSLPDRSSGVLA